jgi:hypothetical protein
MKDLKDLEGATEVEVDTKMDKLVEEDQFIVTTAMSKGIFQEIVHFQEDPDVHTAGIILTLLKTVLI